MYYGYEYFFIHLYNVFAQKNKNPSVVIIAKIKDKSGYLIEIIEKINRKTSKNSYFI